MRIHNRHQRGVALITVILILLVLTVLGMAATMMMTQEDRLSSRQETQKEAFYAAETGLRHGERICERVTFTAQSLTNLLQQTFDTVPDCPATNPPQPVHPPPGRDTRLWTLQTLGNYLGEGGVAVANRELRLASISGMGRTRRAYYSLYIRNNTEDAGNIRAAGAPPANVSPDNRLRLIAVGFITDGEGVRSDGTANVLAVRVLEEEMAWRATSSGMEAMEGLGAGGTSSGQWTGVR